MKIINKISVLLSAVLFAGLLTSCSEFMLIPISIDYPFPGEDGKESADSPSTFTINIDQGLKDVENMFNKEANSLISASSEELNKVGIEVNSLTFQTDDILKLVSGETIEKTFCDSSKIPQGFEDTLSCSKTFSICDFKDSFKEETGKDKDLTMEFKNIDDFCNSDNREQIVETCKKNLTQEERLENKCIYLEVVQNNESIAIKMAEHKDLKKYKKYLNKIYSATLSEFVFTMQNPLSDDPGNDAFQFSAELYAQALDPFKKDGNGNYVKCDDKDCEYKGIDNDGNLEENYFSATDETGALKYRIGVFENDDDAYSAEQVMDLLYTYDGKHVLQDAIKHLDFQLGIKSRFIFYPQAAKPAGILKANIKAKLLFNVEPLN